MPVSEDRFMTLEGRVTAAIDRLTKLESRTRRPENCGDVCGDSVGNLRVMEGKANPRNSRTNASDYNVLVKEGNPETSTALELVS
jgi:hypothetical protein